MEKKTGNNAFRKGFLIVLFFLLLWCLLLSGGCAMLLEPSPSDSDREFRSHIITRPPKPMVYYSQPRYDYWNESNYYKYHHKKGR